MQYTEIVFRQKKKNKKKSKLIGKNLIVLHAFAQNIHRGRYTIEPPNEYPQCMFLIKNKKIMYTPANPRFSIYKWGLRTGTV